MGSTFHSSRTLRARSSSVNDRMPVSAAAEPDSEGSSLSVGGATVATGCTETQTGQGADSMCVLITATEYTVAQEVPHNKPRPD